MSQPALPDPPERAAPAADMSPEELRRAGAEIFEWIAQYIGNLRDMPVLPSVSPGDVRAALPAHAPEQGESFDRIFADFQRKIVPGLTHWNHPRFHAWFSVSASGPGILAEALAAAVNVNAMLWKSAPAASELELTVLSWLRQWLGLPESFFGVIYDTASISTLHAILAARDFVAPESRRNGVPRGLTVYCSEQAHSSIDKAVIAAGIGADNVRRIPVDSEYRMDIRELVKALAADYRAGRRPCCVIPTVGTTSTTSIDPVAKIGRIASEYNVWLHVDGAYGACAAVVPELRHVLDGVAACHSLVVNPHKWLFTPIDCSVLYTSHPEILRRVLSLTPEYLQTGQDDSVVNLMDYGVPLGRRFRALKLWFVMRWFGREGISAILRSHVEMAREFAQWVRSDERFELCAPVPLSVVCFRLRQGDEATKRLLARVNDSGRAFLSHTVLENRYVVRLAIGNVRTTREDVGLVWKTIQEAATPLD